MNTQELTNLINANVTSYREYRLKYAQIVLQNEQLFKSLLEIAFDETNEASIRISWVLDFVMREKLELIYPHLDYFTINISRSKHDSIVRPMAKICENLAIEYTSKKPSEIKKYITQSHIQKIVETGFDWLITDQKVAVKAYTMETLYLFGKEIDWVHRELMLILEQEIVNGSPAYKARGKKILNRLNKEKFS
ncbi:hypothetical protein [Urechidicola croceus]|uniref:Adenylosuccinate lyase n=1 Tax=Urechidicola croceus TaxID=1850246 RepID=A0A1D8P611_9FLAO|nr:hypothetical protein [Urechidicola croceus]AOW19999.1 hypothetical protein LPB138_04565 [Urechidicola croceus]